MADVKARVQAAIAAREAATRQASVPFRAPVFNSFLSSSGRVSCLIDTSFSVKQFDHLSSSCPP